MLILEALMASIKKAVRMLMLIIVVAVVGILPVCAPRRDGVQQIKKAETAGQSEDKASRRMSGASEKISETSDAKSSPPIAPPDTYKTKKAGEDAVGKGKFTETESRGEKSSPDKKSTGIDYPKSSGPSGLKAGFADDNKQFNYFIDFLGKYAPSVRHYHINVRERIIIKAVDDMKKPLHNAQISVFGNNILLAKGLTHSDGSFLFFPSEYGPAVREYKAEVLYQQKKTVFTFEREGKRDVLLQLPLARQTPARVGLDIVFVFDTTGSMGEEIERLKRTIELIYLNLSSIQGRPLVRFGMVLYKDRGDEYITKVVPLTGNLHEFEAALNEVEADGGGDLEEDLQSALYDTLNRIQWSNTAIRMGFIITDAPPHLDYGQSFTYVHAMKSAREKGIKLFSVGTGGLDIKGEYVLRQISQYTGGKYIFLTYGEKGESEGGREGSVSHHTGANFQTDKLESIIIRFARDELNNVLDKKIEVDEHFSAKKVDYEKHEDTLRKLFDMAASQLVDYSSLNLQNKTPTSILPIEPSDPALKTTAEYFGEQLSFSLAKSDIFALVERKNLQGILKELELSMSGLAEEANAAKVGKLLGAKLLVAGKLYKKKNEYELFLKLVRVETAEVLSVTKARLDFALGLSEQKGQVGKKKSIKEKTRGK